MQKSIDIHNYDKLLESTIKRMKASSISERNKKLIEKFNDFCFASSIGKARVVKYTQTLKTLALWLKKDFDKVKKKDLEKLVTSIQQNGNYSEWTKKDFKVFFYLFVKLHSGQNRIGHVFGQG